MFLSGDEWGSKIQLCQNGGEEMLRSQNVKNCSFLSQSIDNQKLYNIFFLTWKRGSPMLISPPDWAQGFTWACTFSKVISVSFVGFEFSSQSYPLPPTLTAPKWWVFVPFFVFFKFLAQISPFQIKLGSWNWISRLGDDLECVFWGFQLFSSILSDYKPEYIGSLLEWYSYFLSLCRTFQSLL